MAPRSKKPVVKKPSQPASKTGQPKKGRPPKASRPVGNDGSSFAAVLDIIIRTQDNETLPYGWEDKLRTLRLVCKATKSVIDHQVQTVSDGSRSYGANNSFNDLYCWPWPNVTTMQIRTGGCGTNRVVNQDDVEILVTIPLPNLSSLRLRCQSLAPLLESNWPLLTDLDLELCTEKEEFQLGKKPRKSNKKQPEVTYPNSLRFPKWPLKKLTLNADINTEKGETHALKYPLLGPLLKSLPELTDFKFTGTCTDETAMLISAAPLPQLQSLKIRPNRLRPGEEKTNHFFSKLFKQSNWPALKDLKISAHTDYCNSPSIPLTLPTAKSMVANLVNVTLQLNETLKFTELCTFMKGLEKGRVEKLDLSYGEYPLNGLLKVFGSGGGGLKLGKLKELSLYRMLTEDLEGDRDITEYMNLLFDSSFPNLETMDLGFKFFNDYPQEEESEDDGDIDIYNSEEEDQRPSKPSRLCKWLEPPNTKNPFPKLTEFKLCCLSLSRPVGDYLGGIQKKSGGGCRLDVERSHLKDKDLSPDREQFLRKLGINIRKFKQVIKNSICTDLFCWGTLSDDHFRLSAYAAALVSAACSGHFEDDEDAWHEYTGKYARYGKYPAYDFDEEKEKRGRRIEEVLKMIESDLEDGELTEAVSEPLKKLLEKLAYDKVNDEEYEDLDSWVRHEARRLTDFAA